MKKGNRISEEFSDEDLQAVLAAIALIKKKMPWLITLASDESRSLRNLGFDGVPYAQAALDAVRADLEFTRRSFDLEEFERDVKLHAQLRQVNAELAPLSQKTRDTERLVGADMMVTSDDIYEDMTKDDGETAAVQAPRRIMARRYQYRRDADDTTPAGK